MTIRMTVAHSILNREIQGPPTNSGCGGGKPLNELA
jgi:hypothetical protein